MKIGACYLRMSTDKQEHSIESQLRIIKEYAKRNNIFLNEQYIYSDEGISGRNAEKRPKFMQMIEDSYKKLFDCILIYDSSRFARNLEQSIVYKSVLKRNNVELISVTEPVIDEDNSLLTDALFGAMNEMYSRKLSKNVKRGMEQKALRGEYLSCAAYGYDRKEKNKPLVINSDEAKIIEYVFEQYINNKSFYCIARELNLLGIQSKKGNPIEKRWVEYVLKNPIYKGYLRWKPEGEDYIIKKADHEPIINEAIFDKVQEKINTQTAKRKYKEKPVEVCRHWLSGLIRCKSCGSTLSYANGWKGRQDRFRCGGYMHGKCIMSKTIRVTEMEFLIIDTIRNICTSKKSSYTLNIRPINNNNEEIKAIDKQIEKINKSLERAKKAFLAGIDSILEYKETKQSLSAELAYITEKKEKLKNTKLCVSQFKDNLKNVVEILEADSEIADKKLVARNIIEKIAYNGSVDNLELYFFQ